MKPRVLFVSYDGLMEPLGQSQILQYLQSLSDHAEISLLTFEKPADLARKDRLTDSRARLASLGVRWTALTYHKAPAVLSTAFDLSIGSLAAAWICLSRGVQIVHARSYPPAVIAWLMKNLLGRRFIFDMRGLWADQRVECGAWKADARAYKLAKWFERRFLTSADAVVSETRAAIAVIKDFPYMRSRNTRFDVVPTCTNLELFKRPDDRRDGRPFTLGIVGSLGVWYDFAEMIDCFAHLRRGKPDARLLVVTRSSHEDVYAAVASAGLPRSSCECVSAEFSQVPALISRMDAAVFFLRRCPSVVAVSPTKLGELLACGVPCLVNSGCGDIDEIVEDGRTGAVLRDYSPADKSSAIRRLVEVAADPQTPERCAQSARRHFDLARGVSTYSTLYEGLAGAK